MRRLFILFLFIFHNVSLFGTHAAGMDISYQCISAGTPGTPTTTLVGNGSITVNIQTTIWAYECYWTITNSSGVIVASGGQGGAYSNYGSYFTVHCLPAGSYTFNWFDTYGDGWHGGSYTVSNSSGSIITNGSPPSGSSGSSTFNVAGPCTNIYQTTYTGGTPDTYKITVKFYRDCDGIGAPGSLSLSYSSASCGVSSSISLYQVGPGVVITPICPSMNSTCTGGSIIGIEEYTYEATIVIPKCNDWVFSTSVCCRNHAINTINGPGAEELRIEATLDNSTLCNNSPTFTEYPVPYICTNTPYCYNNGATDIDGDSLVYSLIDPLTDAGTVTYNGGYSSVNPVGGTSTTFSPITGNLCMNPPSPLTSVVAIKVEEYRNGVLIGSIIRDIQVNVLSCVEPPPYLTGIDTSAAVDSDPTGQIGSYTLCTDGNSSINFNIDALTNSTNTNLTMGWNSAISGANFTVSNNGTPSPQGNFSWTPSLSDIMNSPFYFVVTVTDDACPLMGSFSYSYQINLNYSSGSFVKNDISCFGANDGSIDLSVIGAAPPYNYYWWDSISGFTSNIEDIYNLGPGDYYCWITDSLGDTLGCGLEPIHATIIEPSELTHLTSFMDVSCNSLSDGSINLLVSGGTPLSSSSPYSIIWSSSNGYTGSGANISGLSPGIYTAIITDVNNCGPIIDSVAINEPLAMTLFGNYSDISCFGYSDGHIDLTTTGTGLSYNWNGPGGPYSTEDIDSLGPGVYTINLIDTNGCIGPSSSFTITEPNDIIVDDTVTHVSCFSGNDGAIDLTITGGAGNYNTVWTGPGPPPYFNISEDIFTLSSGFYSYSITDANGCNPSINNSPILVTQPADVSLTAAVVDETCYGYADGSIDVTISGPGVYSYSWVGPNSFLSSSLDISSLEAGTYTLTVTDQNNCNKFLSETIDIGNFIVVNPIVEDVTCNNFDNGDISLFVPNSSNPNFIWSGPSTFYSTSSHVDSLEPGNYSVIVNDESNCPTQLFFTITEPPMLDLSSVILDESCENYSDGEIQAVVSGGTPDYTYVWNNGISTPLNSNIGSGEYILNVIDSNNCIVSDTFNVGLYLFDITSQVTDVKCYGGTDGAIDISIVGGSSPFTYSWSNSITTQDISAVPSNIYTVNISDATNCVITRDIAVTEPQQLSVVSNLTHILCYGDSTGNASLQITGGIPPYMLDWGSVNPSLMIAGYHNYVVTDSNLCKFADSIEILQPDSIYITANITHVQCYGDMNGQIDVQIAQGTGTPPYDYLWYGPNNFVAYTEDIYSLGSGIYEIYVTDNNMCLATMEFEVEQPLDLSQVTNINTSNYSGYNVRCKGENSAWIKLEVAGGYSPYSYVWNNGEITDSIYNLYAGSYSVIITDSLGCVENLSINLNEPPTYLNANVLPTTDYNGYNISCFGKNDGAIMVHAIDGVPPYTYLWNNNFSTDSIVDLYSGYYEVLVYDKNMCLTIDSISLDEPSELFFTLLTASDTCGKEVGLGEVIADGGVPPYFADWSHGDTSLILDNLSEGDYSVVVSDNNSCQKSKDFLIENLISPIADFEAYPYHKRLIDQRHDPFYFVDISKTFWSSIKYWTWNFGDLTFAYDSLVSHSYLENGVYTVHLEIITEANCIDTISKDVVVDEYSFYIPNSFMPSSDVIENSIFKGYGIGINEYELKVFSRWGELIFSTNILEEGWDGTHYLNNAECPGGIYTYTVFIENIYEEIFEYQGQFRLLR